MAQQSLYAHQVLVVLSGMCLIAAAGCASKNDRDLEVREVAIVDFVGDGQTDAPSVTASAEDSEDVAGDVGEVVASASTTTNNSDQSMPSNGNSPAGPAASAPAQDAATARVGPGERLMQPGDVVIIDSVIGQVSGRPIFADELLSPIAEMLRRESERLSPNEFQMLAQQVIMNQLREVVLEQLFIAEAEAALTEEQQFGLMAFLRDLQEKTIASGQGSRTVTEERMLEEMGMTIEQYTERERNAVLIWLLINRKVQPRVIVSWKEVQRAYELRKGEFNPPSSITYSRITLSKQADAELVSRITQMFADGASFASVVEVAGAANVSKEGPFTLGPDGVSNRDVSDVIRPHLLNLKLDETSPPIEIGTRVMWWHVDEIKQPPARDLYDVQRELLSELEQRRQTEERERYIQTLFERGMHDELDEMLRRALTVAMLRYGR